MNKSLKNKNTEVIKVNNNDIEVVESKGSLGREVLTTVALEFAKAAGPALIDLIKKKNDLEAEIERETKKDYITYLRNRQNTLLEHISTEEAKVDYDQKRIDQWLKELKDISEEQKRIGEASDAYTKGWFRCILQEKSA